jgi:L-seryl-tRNA(Ser) seleniumtransferase
MKYEEIAPRVKKFKRRLVRLLPEHEIEMVDGVSKVGSGAFPIQELPSVLISVRPKDMGAETAARLLRLSNPSVFVRVAQDVILIDLRTVFPEEEVHLMRCLGEVLGN